MFAQVADKRNGVGPLSAPAPFNAKAPAMAGAFALHFVGISV
jgi:hypothetical protein